MEQTHISKYDTETLNGTLFAELLRAGAANLLANKDEVNDLNVFPVPDGDTGDNMGMTVRGGVAALDNVTEYSLSDVSETAAQGMLLGARGNSGVILSQFFAGIISGFKGLEKADISVIKNSLNLGVKRAYSAVIKPTEGTILTVAKEGAEFAKNISDNATVGELVDALVSGMKESLSHTPEKLPILAEAGVVDSGGAGLVYIFEGFLAALKGEEINVSRISETAAAGSSPDLSAFGPDSEMTYGYCTELLLRLQNSKVDVEAFEPSVITEFLETVGDSIVAFKTDSAVKIHVHTLTPEKVLEFCRKYGEFLTVKIENMSLQHSELNAEVQESKKAGSAIDLSGEKKKFGFIEVASGNGIKKTLRDLGADIIVDGGQTNNPSISDFIDAFNSANAEHIFVFPNNGNIIMAAKAAAEMYDGDVRVIESRDLGAGYVALSSLDPSAADADTVESMLNDAMADVDTGLVSVAIRDAEMNGVSIKEGSYIGFVGKTMLVCEENAADAACRLIDKLLENGEKYMLTVFTGQDATQNGISAIEKHLESAHSDTEIYFADGGQDVYPYIIIAE